MEQSMNIGQFVAAEIIILLVIGSVEKIILGLETIYDVLTSLEKIGQVTDLELEDSDGIELKRTDIEKGLNVQVNNVTFSYPQSDHLVLKNIDFNVESGETIIINGSNGSGKSTLLHVISGLYDLQAGTISYNGIPRNNLELTSLRSILGACLVEEALFEGTLLENITIGRESVSFENVQWAIKGLGLDEYVRRLPKGYDTQLEPLGKKLPRSIVQRLLIARSIADKPKLLLFEYAFEYLDAKDRFKIIDFITDKNNGWTIIAISNEDYLASKADKIAIMNQGTFSHFDTYQALNKIAKLNITKDA
jgi:ABC-type bacteriocin/lantibiotic exporter with double-glycine peptidase domain